MPSFLHRRRTKKSKDLDIEGPGFCSDVSLTLNHQVPAGQAHSEPPTPADCSQQQNTPHRRRTRKFGFHRSETEWDVDRKSNELSHSSGSMISLFRRFLDDSSKSPQPIPTSCSSPSVNRMSEDSVQLQSMDDWTVVGQSVSANVTPCAGQFDSVDGELSPSKGHSHHHSATSIGTGSRSFFSFASNSSDIATFSKLRKKTIPRFFSVDDSISAPSTSPTRSSTSQRATRSSNESASRTWNGSLQVPADASRPHPMIRSISSKSQETRKDIEVEPQPSEYRPRSHTLNSLQNSPTEDTSSNGTGPLARSSSEINSARLVSSSAITSLFGFKNDVLKSKHSPSSSQFTFQLSLLDMEPLLADDDESIDEYLERVCDNRMRSTIVAVISKCEGEFYSEALQTYIDRNFDFADDPMDMALRKFLMYVQLPRETQQIDRVLECFAETYQKCNANIYSSSENAYIVAFSLMILHTDFFNKSNKHKMQKWEYLRNTYAKGVSKEILECFYDNITYTPFIHTDDDPGVTRDRYWSRRSSSFGRNGKDPIDPYTLILENRLDMLRPSMQTVLVLEDPYDFLPIKSQHEYNVIREEFIHGPYLQLVSQRSRPEAFLSADGLDRPENGVPGIVDVKVVKIGVLFRREAKRIKYSKSTWREWGAILTASQLYLFKDVSWIKSYMLNQPTSDTEEDAEVPGRRIIRAPIDGFRPSAVLPTIDMVALLHNNGDVSQLNTFLIAGRGGAQDWFATSSQDEMNDWMRKINFAASFNTYHIGIYGLADMDRSLEHKNRIKKQIDKSPLLSGNESLAEKISGDTSTDCPTDSSSTDDSSENPSIVVDSAVESDTPNETSTSSNTDCDPSSVLDDHIQRHYAVLQKLQDIDTKLQEMDNQLADHIQTGHHLRLLAPIQQRTRESVIFAAGRLAAKLDWTWLDRRRLLCYKQLFVQERDTEKQLCDLLEHGDNSTTERKLLRNTSNPSISETVTSDTTTSTAVQTDNRQVSDNQEDSGQQTMRPHLTGSSTESSQSTAHAVSVQRQVSAASRTSHSSAASQSGSSSGITVKKNFHRLSLRDKKRVPAGATKEECQEEVPQRRASLLRKEDGDFTLHGKKFSVVEVNPEYATTPNHQRRASQAAASVSSVGIQTNNIPTTSRASSMTAISTIGRQTVESGHQGAESGRQTTESESTLTVGGEKGRMANDEVKYNDQEIKSDESKIQQSQSYGMSKNVMSKEQRSQDGVTSKEQPSKRGVKSNDKAQQTQCDKSKDHHDKVQEDQCDKSTEHAISTGLVKSTEKENNQIKLSINKLDIDQQTPGNTMTPPSPSTDSPSPLTSPIDPTIINNEPSTLDIDATNTTCVMSPSSSK